MKCERAENWFSNLIEGTLEPPQEVVLRAHLAECQKCTAAVESLRRTLEAVERLPEPKLPPTLRATIWQRIDAAQTAEASKASRSGPSRSPVRFWVRTAAALGAASVLLVLASVTVPGKFRAAGWTSWFHRPSPQSPSPLPTPASVQMTASAKRMAADQGTAVRVAVQLSGAPVRARIMLLQGDVLVAERRAPIAPPGTELTLVPERGTSPDAVRIEWQGARGTAGDLRLDLK